MACQEFRDFQGRKGYYGHFVRPPVRQARDFQLLCLALSTTRVHQKQLTQPATTANAAGRRWPREPCRHWQGRTREWQLKRTAPLPSNEVARKHHSLLKNVCLDIGSNCHHPLEHVLPLSAKNRAPHSRVGIWKSKTQEYQSRGMRMSEPSKKAFNAERLLVTPTILMKADVLLWTVPLLPTNSFHLKCLNRTCTLAARLAVHFRWYKNPIQNIFQLVNCPGSPRGFTTPSQDCCNDLFSELNAKCSETLVVGLYRYQTAPSLHCQPDQSAGECRSDG